MKGLILRLIFAFFFLSGISRYADGIDSLKTKFSLNYYRDLSDTYGGGSMFSGEVGLTKMWFGSFLSFGHFQSNSTFIYKIEIDDINRTIEIPFEEISIMQSSSFSLSITPIDGKIIAADILFGGVLAKAKSLRFKSVNYSYNLIEDEFIYLHKEYEFISKNHLGYQVGFNISFFITEKIGLQINSRMQHLSKGGTFFFLGSGLCFKL